MTNKQYGFTLATIFSAVPGGFGTAGIMMGGLMLDPWRVVMGGILLIAATVIYSVLAEAAEKRSD